MALKGFKCRPTLPCCAEIVDDGNRWLMIRSMKMKRGKVFLSLVGWSSGWVCSGCGFARRIETFRLAASLYILSLSGRQCFVF